MVDVIEAAIRDESARLSSEAVTAVGEGGKCAAMHEAAARLAVLAVAAGRWEWITRRLLVLAAYGYNMDYFAQSLDEPEFLTVAWLEGYFGKPVEPYVVEALEAVEPPTVERFYFTFGGNHLHANEYVVIAGDYETARVEMFRRFGGTWAFQYDEAQWTKDGKTLAEKHGLTEFAP